jgi:hypothetical protein
MLSFVQQVCNFSLLKLNFLLLCRWNIRHRLFMLNIVKVLSSYSSDSTSYFLLQIYRHSSSLILQVLFSYFSTLTSYSLINLDQHRVNLETWNLDIEDSMPQRIIQITTLAKMTAWLVLSSACAVLSSSCAVLSVLIARCVGIR